MRVRVNICHFRQLNEGAGFFKQLIEGAGFFNKPSLKMSETRTYLPDDVLQGTELMPGWCQGDAEVGHERARRMVAIGSRSVLVTLVPEVGLETLVRVEVLREMHLRRVIIREPLVASVRAVPYDWDWAGLLRCPGWHGGTGGIWDRSFLSLKAWTTFDEDMGVLARAVMLLVRGGHRGLSRYGLLLRLFWLTRENLDHFLIVVDDLIDGVEFGSHIDVK
jgi:hypothetical protein